MALFLVFFVLGIFIFLIGLLVFYYVGLWKLFKKAGRNGWEAIVPFYNNWVLVEIAGLDWWYALIVILASVGALSMFGILAVLALTVIHFFVYYNLSKKMHRDTGVAVLMWLFPFIMIPIVGISDKYQYDKDVLVSKNGPFDDNSVRNNNFDNYENSQFNQGINKDFSERRFCSNCGKQFIEGARFCQNCGKEIEK